ncbi:hypothetical protein COT87_02645, partial [Candidatus Collierbacteria bacterium CG10_big_fil_rev_8_21_14_0_10_44_9]
MVSTFLFGVVIMYLIKE